VSQEALWSPDESESLGRTWGLDPSTVALALGVHNGLHYATTSCGLPRHTDPARRLAAALPVAEGWLEQCVQRYGKPSLVMVEQPAAHGHNVHPQTWYATGMVLMAVAVAVDCPVMPITPTSWKAAALGKGHGHAPKKEVGEWAREQGWRGVSLDEADTCGIARCAYLRLAGYLKVT
jgi:Holliday junction resolvasome RuvABC endonuclease subunit